jgi:hypothetical protein
MNWYNKAKLATTYTALVCLNLKSVLRDVRFIMYHATGSSMFVKHKDGDMYEVRVEDAKYSSNLGNTANVGQCLGLLREIENSGLFSNIHQDNSGVSFIGDFKSIPHRISVIHWKSSPYRQFFEDTMLPARNATETVPS